MRSTSRATRACASEPFRARTKQSFERAENRRRRNDSCPTAPSPVKLFPQNVKHESRDGFCPLSLQIDWRRQIVPNLAHVTVRVGAIQVRLTRTRLRLATARRAEFVFVQ